VVWGEGVYAVPRAGRLLIGATVEDAGFNTALTDEAATSLRARAERLMPGLRNWTLADHWAGLRPRAPDGLPLLGPTHVGGLYLASGQHRNGLLLAPAMAQAMADALLNDTPLPAAFDPCRFAP
jgi:glycine oxidase